MPRSGGYTLIELLIALALVAVLYVGIGGVASQALQTHDYVSDNNDLTREARFAMEQMVRAVSRSPRLLLPLADNLNTAWPENIRVEPAPPVAPSIKSTAVLAVTQDPAVDLDGNGRPDVDNDGDGRIDEDLPSDATKDGAAGITGIDDNGDGIPDDSAVGNWDDDEDDSADEDTVYNNNDADGDGSIDEDPNADMNFDFLPGIADVDDDEDGNIDEGGALNSWNDDEDGLTDEDWYDPVVFYLVNRTLMQRIPVPWDANGSGSVTGSDFIETPIAENVNRFRVERLPPKGNRPVLVDLILELTSPTSSETVSLHHRVRLGGAL
jgi:prepilin-type N-terminal cleavage/methylation domain-containing protein